MKGNFSSLTELAARIERIDASKLDLLAHTSQLKMVDDTTLQVQPNGDPHRFAINNIAQTQIVERMRPSLQGITKAYWDSMTGFPGLREYTVNRWLEKADERRLVRTLDGNVRAFLSDGFKPWENIDMLSGILPVLRDLGNGAVEVMSASLTEARMYLQLSFPRLTAEVKVGDAVRAGITISNSEVGQGAWDVRAWLLVLRCTNGAMAESLLRKYHVGRRVDDAEDGVFKSDTIEADRNAAKLQLRDVVGHALSEAAFNKRVNKLRAADSQQLTDPVKAVENVTKRYQLSDDQGKTVLQNLIKGGEPTRWGLSNAITALARELEDKDRAFDLERAGYDVIELAPSEWSVVDKGAAA